MPTIKVSFGFDIKTGLMTVKQTSTGLGAYDHMAIKYNFDDDEFLFTRDIQPGEKSPYELTAKFGHVANHYFGNISFFADSGENTARLSYDVIVLTGRASSNAVFVADVDWGNRSANDYVYNDSQSLFIDVGNGDDIVKLGGGNDRVRGGRGNDVLDGGSGTDTLDYTNSTAGVVVNLGKNYAYGGFAEGDSISNFERVLGSNSNDTLTGTSGSNLLKGYSGRDALYGGSGADELRGGGDIDRLEGQAGADLLFGEGGNDLFVFRRHTDSSASSFERDTIMDWNKGDKIHLSLMDANANLAGDQGFAFIGKADFSEKAGQLRAFQSGGSTYVQGDIDGDGSADFAIKIAGLVTLGSADFAL